jgi:hypothetical protein
MFSNHKGPASGQAAKVREGFVNGTFTIGGIHKDQIEGFPSTGKPAECLIYQSVNHVHPVLDPTKLDIRANQSDSVDTLINKNRLSSPSTQGLQAQRSGPGEKVQNPGRHYRRPDNAKNCLTHAIRSRPDFPAFWSVEPSSPKSAGDNAHDQETVVSG